MTGEYKETSRMWEAQASPVRQSLQPAFLVIVHVEEEAHLVRMRTELRDVRLVVFEITVRQFADEFALHLLIPAHDHLCVLDLRMLTQPRRHFVVARAGRDELLEMVGLDAGDLPQERGQ